MDPNRHPLPSDLSQQQQNQLRLQRGSHPDMGDDRSRKPNFSLPPGYPLGPAAPGQGDSRGPPGPHHPSVRRSPYGGPGAAGYPQSFEGGGGGQPLGVVPKPGGRPPSASDPQGPAGNAFRGGHPAHGFPGGVGPPSRSDSWGQAPQDQGPFSPSKHNKPGGAMMHHPALKNTSGHGDEQSRHVPTSAGSNMQMQGQPGSDMGGMKGYPGRDRPPMPQAPSPQLGPKQPGGGQPQQSPMQQTALSAMQQQQGVRQAPPTQPPGGMSFPPGAPQLAGQPVEPQQPPAHGMMRELRVEDALLYLDDVKREFRDQPGVYNEFLTIMKNFKTQAVDTPGVIARVSRLFRGYNALILGFNTFLPEGYKISLADLERAERERQAQEEAEAQVRRQREIQQQQQQQQQQIQQQQQQQQQIQQQQIQQQQIQQQQIQQQQIQQQQQMQIEQARPKELPRHAPSPPYSNQVEAIAQAQMPPVAITKASPPVAKLPPPPPPPSIAVKEEPQQMDAKAPRPTEAREQDGSTPKKGQPSIVRPKPRPAQQKKKAFEPPPQQQHAAVEFDHAISYVTQIKRRFANDPDTYHSFLEILHTYQKEQRGIKEVLEQVARLFQDHPDLLKEFTFFLPDAVQEQAKERLHRAAAESETRLAIQRQAELDEYNRAIQQQNQPIDTASSGATAQQQMVDVTGRNKRAPEGPPSSAPVAPPVVGTRKRPLEGQSIPHSQQQPETYVYSSAVERQFFDLVKEALSTYSRDGGQAWAEFMKCLDMYAQEVLSRTEMLTFVEPLLGKRNAKLFDEFKRILAVAGSTAGPVPPLEDAWYSVPLSEIDFSRCRRCTLSYRALPRDYPAPPCTERSELEQKVLNDTWVSLPVGSEESYTFRHMRRNTYEEQLFRCEDERFEIDMVIDSNAATLQRLIPFVEEIARLSKSEIATDEFGLKNPNEGAGIAGKRFQYTFDKSVLGVIHRNTITRIYGDAGQEMLDLMVKNPVVAIPLVVERLRQKDKEWKRVRDRLRVDWRKLVESNYYKSLDHRGLTWRTTDKRATSTRTLLSELKDRSLHRGKEGKEALRVKLEKAKEEHGTFFEVTMADTLAQDLDLTFLPRPDRLLFTPHLSVLYENNSWAQRDAYRILSFALERGTINPHDKERCHRLWAEFLGPWFGLTQRWMNAPAVSYQESPKRSSNNIIVAPPAVISEEEDDSMDDDLDVGGGRVVTEEMNPAKASDLNGPKASNSQDTKDYHPLPVGCSVSTMYGEGTIKEFRHSDQMYVVQLSYGIAYLRPSTGLCTLMHAEKSRYTDQLRADDRSRLVRPTDQLAIGTQSMFLVFRLHQILIQRLSKAMSLAHSVGQDKSLCTLVEQMPGLSPQAAGRLRYEAYLSLVYTVLDGGHVGEYEDRLRSLLGHGAYELATMDKLVSHLWKNLQTVAQDETMWNLIQLYRRHRDAGSFQPESFRQEAAYLSDGELMYAFQWCPISETDQGVMHFEYLGVIAEEEEDDYMVAHEDEEMAESEAVVSEHHSKRQKR